MKYLSFDIYRSSFGDCTNNGASSLEKAQGKIMLVPCEFGNWSDDDILLNPDRFTVFDIEDNRLLRPRSAGSKWTMMGGNFGYTSDSRFRANVSTAPMPIHDRIEG